MLNCAAFIADEVTTASFGRLNFYGTNLGETVLVPTFPYNLRTTFVVVLYVPALKAVHNLNLSLTSRWMEPLSYNFGTFEAEDRDRRLGIMWSELPIVVPNEGTFTLNVSCDGFTWNQEWTVKCGSGPHRASVTRLPSAGLIDGRRNWDPLADLMKEVRSDILIVDQYLTPEFLESILPTSASAWKIRVVVGNRMVSKFVARAATFQTVLPNLQVRADDLIHDRFICRDDEDVYAFGHSLKDLLNKRVSFFHRIHDADQEIAIRAVMEDTWTRAAIVL